MAKIVQILCIGVALAACQSSPQSTAGTSPVASQQAASWPADVPLSARPGCHSAEPISDSCRQWLATQPGCPAGTPEFITDLPPLTNETIQMVDFAVEECLGGGYYVGPGVGSDGYLYGTVIVYHHTAPGYTAPPTGVAGWEPVRIVI